MTAGERFRNWISDIASGFADRLREWMSSWLAWGIELILDTVGRGMGKRLDVIIDAFAEKYDIPPDIVADVKEAWKGEGEWQAILGGAAGGTAVGSLIGSTIGPWLKLLEYMGLRIAKPFRLDPALLINIWLRDKEKYETFFQDLRDQGYDQDRLDIIKELSKIIPPLADMVRFADFGSFDPKIIELWREFYDAPGWISEPMSLLGITNEPGRDWANKYWFSHWRQPGRFELGEIYRRGLLGKPLIGQDEVGGGATIGEAEELVKNAYLTQGFSPFWQDHLLQLVREIPTRVDVRRWWDMRTIDEAELRSIYQRHGYFGKDLENYVIWTKVYVAFPDLMARFKNGWITEDDVRSELLALGMPYDRVTELLQTKIKPEEPARVEKDKDLTKTEIYKGVKKDLITWDEGIELLMDLGYDEDEADYILAVNVGVLEGSPETFAEFKDLTTKYKIATGKEVRPMTEELKKAADEVVRLTAEVKALEESITEEKRGLIEGEVLPEETTARLEELQVSRNRAISALELAKSEYNRLIAEWRHGLP